MYTRFTSILLCVIFSDLTLAQLSARDRSKQAENNRGGGGGGDWRHIRRTPQNPTLIPYEFDFESDNDLEIHPLSNIAAVRYRPGEVVVNPPHPCEQSSCYPATGNLLIGRESKLTASSTCGLNSKEKYCIVSHLEDRKKCFWCDSRVNQANTNLDISHRIENIVYRYFPNNLIRSWWQSANGVENASVQLDLEAEFHFTHLIITFRTFRPAAMLIERSYDFGQTWQVYRYFAYNCEESFPGVPRDPPKRMTDVVCTSRYSNVAPSTDGELIFKVLPPNLHIDDPYSQEVQNLLKMTNLRINFTKLHTLGDDLLDKRQEIQEKYYYAIYDMIVRGSCSCYGHAFRCLPLPNVPSKPNMVHGRCECTHFTKGLNCEQCQDFYNDLPWKPAIGKQSNACKKCNCNNHTNTCHFDGAVFERSGRVSGGVCDGCQHNTMGLHCEECRPFYYHDPNKDITDSEACLPCDCDDRGALDDGICDSRTDTPNDLISGRCHCKRNVDGRRCDKCKNGFWNFKRENPEGCQSCTCNELGTINNQGCNVYTGECTCKRYVTGRDCDQCLPEYYGLSEDRDGCKPCDCDAGGSFDNNCDVLTGQCKCRQHVSGRTCNIPEHSYFTAYLDYNVYEAEFARPSDNCQVVIREPYRDGRNITWTGLGFVRAVEDSYIEFTIDNIKRSMEYDIVVRYEPQLPGGWNDVRVVIERPGPVNSDGPCADIPQQDYINISLPQDARKVVIHPPSCLDAGDTYKVRLEFKKYNPYAPTPTASILVDSIALVPRLEAIPFLQGPQINEMRREEYDRFRCGDIFYNANKGSINDVCRKYYNSIGFYVHDGAFDCQCDPTGAYSVQCDSLGGQCQCKPFVVGRRCDRCAPGYYGFGPEGCRACDCNSIGSLDNFCDVQTGKCKCRPNTYGRQCDQCQPGFWNFPNCQRCECNGHADVCDPYSGECTTCRDYTEGNHCDRCAEGFFGDPRIGVDIPCRACPCPGTIESGHSYASRCSLDSRNNQVVCECQEGYAGPRCDVCADNYYGSPDRPGGVCRACECNNNIDISRPGNCDGVSGECKQCLFNTEGFNCEICKNNYFGDAASQNCTECVCNILGTDERAGSCDKSNGQCFCRPNVMGKSCDQCVDNHWKIASGEGCERCDCDEIGSNSPQCNLYDGQCDCKVGFGGRQCNQCEAYYWGDPTIECHECNCNLEGSSTRQCHRNNGTCVCLPGIGGDKCDVCARGYIGEAPRCGPCGECFDNWDKTLTGLKAETDEAVKSASQIKETGATGAYTREFEMMEKKLQDVKQLLEKTSVSSDDLEMVDDIINEITKNLNSSGDTLLQVENDVENCSNRVSLARASLDKIIAQANNLKFKSKELKENSTKLQEGNVEGALNLTRDAQRRSKEAYQRADDTKSLLDEHERHYRRTEGLIQRALSQFNVTKVENKNLTDLLNKRLDSLEEEIPDLNDKICDQKGDPCHPLCGGAGCSSCGGISCESGAVTRASNSYDFGIDADRNIKDKEAKAEEYLRGISQAKQDAVASKELAEAAYNIALLIKNKSESTIQDNDDLFDQVAKFLDERGAQPKEIRALAEEVLKLNIQLQPEQITDLATKINEAIQALTNIDEILSETDGDLSEAKDVEDKTNKSKEDARNVLESAQKVLDSLADAKKAQDSAEEAITKANDDIRAAEKDLTQISSENAEAEQKSTEKLTEANELFTQLRDTQTRILKIERDIREAEEEANSAAKEAKEAQRRAAELRTAFNNAENELHKRSSQTKQALTRSKELMKKANELTVTSTQKLRQLKDTKNQNNENEERLKELSNIIQELNKKMEENLLLINKRSDYYRSCVS